MAIDKQNSRQYINEGLKGWKRFLPLINIALFVGVLALGILGVVLFRAVSSPLPGLERQKAKIQPQQVSAPTIKTNIAPKEDYDLIANENPFAPGRKEWVQPQPKTPHGTQKQGEVEPPPKVPPKKLDLYGIAIFENLKKALVRNPDPAKYGIVPFLYIEEGNDVGGYKVKTIEPNLIRLVWEEQEFVVNIFADKENVKTLPIPGTVPQPQLPPPQQPRPEAHRRAPHEMEFPQGRDVRGRAEEEYWDEASDEDWDEEEEDWAEEEIQGGESEEGWEEGYNERPRPPHPKGPFRRPRGR